MAYRNPEAECYLIHGCGLDKSHTHTYRFHTHAEQESYFKSQSRAGWHFSELSEIRIYDGYIMLKGNANVAYTCNYLMYKNVQDGDAASNSRWIYAFIDSVQYVNDLTYRVNYTIDWIQTYMVDVVTNPNYAYCIRQHSAKDKIYENTQPEPVSLGGFYRQTPVSGWSNIGVECKIDNDGTFVGWAPVFVTPIEGRTYDLIDGIPQALNYTWGYNWDWFNDFIKEMNEDAKKEIVDIFMYPVYLLNTTREEPDKHYIQKVPLPGKKYNPWGESFTPKNNKLYTYPYSFITVASNQGGRSYRAERFSRSISEAEFHIWGTMGSMPEFICMPVSYGGFTNADESHLNENFFEAVVIKGVPKVPWITDQYKAWLAQKQSQLAVQQISMERTKELQTPNAIYGMLSSLGSLSPTGIANGVVGAIDQYMNTSLDLMSQQAQLQDAENMPITTANYATSDIYYKCGEYGFHALYTYVPVEYARIIDDYFTMFGYTFNTLRKPNFFARKAFTYLKYTGYSTANVANIPESARLQWQNVLQTGITLWDKNITIGDYSADNSV